MGLQQLSYTQIKGAPVNILNFGAVGDGVTDDTAAIQAAINSLSSKGGAIYIPQGSYVITSTLNISGKHTLKFYGDSNGLNDPQNLPTCFYTKNLADYVFHYSGIDQELEIVNLAFDGSNNGGSVSTVWKGLLASDNAANTAFLHINNVSVGGSNSATPCLDISTLFTGYIENCNFGYWGNYIQVKMGLVGFTTTTLTFRNCRFHYARQCVEIGVGCLDVSFDNCIFESSIIALASAGSNVLLTGCYFENIGYDPTGTGVTSGITPRNVLGISYSPAMPSTVTSAVFCQYGKLTFIACHFAYLAIAPSILTSWFDGVGRGSSLGSGGTITVLNPSFNAQNIFFRLDSDAVSSRGPFVYEYTYINSTGVPISYSDLRLISKGLCTCALNDGTQYIVSIDSGVITALADNDIILNPTSYPLNGQWLVGDKVNTIPLSGGSSVIECFTSGTNAAEWAINSFNNKKKSLVVAAGTSTTFTIPLMRYIGDATVVQVLGSLNNTDLQYVAEISMLFSLSNYSANYTNVIYSIAGTSATAIVVSNNGVDTITITLTNNNASPTFYSFNILNKS